MCDTVLAPPGSTAEHVMLFGKNSDRQRNEAQAVQYFPRAEYPPDTQLACTYISIAQARSTHAVLLCRPFWLWGAEMGANEHGVAIGNEGLYARGAAPKTAALTGMDLLRLALERASSAEQAVDVITTLLEQHGQGGNCGHIHPDYYHNGFIVADPRTAFVLETVGKDWLVERIHAVRTISNAYSIAEYANAISDPDREHIGHAGLRRARATSLLTAQEGNITATSMMSVLRDHGVDASVHDHWHPARAATRTLCAHAASHERRGQTVGSLVSELRTGESVHWVTGTASPCLSIFKPVLLDVPLPDHGPVPIDRFDPRTLWWSHERLHRAAVFGDFARLLDDIQHERDALEAKFSQRIAQVRSGGATAERVHAIQQCWQEALQTERRWCERVGPAAAAIDADYLSAWDGMNQMARIEITTQ